MPSLQDSALIFILALLLFGPKKLPVLARELGKWIGEFRRASNEFKMQMEEELRLSEQADRQKEVAALEAAAPAVPLLEGIPTEDPEHPHTSTYEAPDYEEYSVQPIATSADLSIMPPATGLPVPQTNEAETPEAPDAPTSEPEISEATQSAGSDGLGSLIESIPVVDHAPTDDHVPENAAHG